MNRSLIIFILVILSFSCSKIRNFEQATHTKSQIDPLFEAKTINEKFNGDSVKLKVIVPLSKNTIGHYNLDDVMAPTCDEDDPNYEKCLEKIEQVTDNSQQNFIQRIGQSLKYKLFNFGIGLGISNRVKYSTDYEFPEMDLSLFKEVKVSKIFFALEECEQGDRECEYRDLEHPITFDFIDKFFVNLSVIQNKDSLNFLDDPLKFLSKKEFNRYADEAFSQNTLDFDHKKNEYGIIPEKAFYNVTLARLYNDKKSRKQRRRQRKNNIRDNGKTFIFNIEKENIMEAKKFFKSKAFDGVVNDVTLIGTSLYVDLFGAPLKDKFFEIINTQVDDIYSLGVKDFKGCSMDSCTNLNVNSVNLVPMLKRSNHLRFDTFVSIRHLDYNDFKYNGYVELSIELDVPY